MRNLNLKITLIPALLILVLPFVFIFPFVQRLAARDPNGTLARVFFHHGNASDNAGTINCHYSE